MASPQCSLSINLTSFISSFSRVPPPCHLFTVSPHVGQFCYSRRSFTFLATSSNPQDKCGRRQVVSIGAVTSWISFNQTLMSFAAETVKGFETVVDVKGGYSFLYPFGWQEVIVEGKDKVLKDVIQPLENVSVNFFPTSKQDIHELGFPQQVAEGLIQKALAPSSQKTRLIEASEHDVDGKTYYRFEFIVEAPNYTRHGLATIGIGNGKLYVLTTGANERRWGKMKDQLHTIIHSYRILTS